MSRSDGAWLNWTDAVTPSSAEARDVLLGQELRVLDARPEPERRPLVAGLFEGVERVAVREVADRVHRDGPTRPCTRAHDLGELLAARDLDARSRRACRAVCEPSVPSMNTFR